MAYKLYGREVFRATVNGTNYTFTCYSQGTQYGFRHICCEGFSNTTVCRYIASDIIAKACYYNRSYERFKYETVLRQAIEKQPKADREQLKAILIDKTAQDEHEKCEKFEKDLAIFQALYEKTSPETKERLKNVTMQNESDVQLVKGIMALDIIFNS